MLKLDGTFPIILTTPAQGVRHGMAGASQQVRQYDITPPPVALDWGGFWRPMQPAFTLKRPGAVAIAAIAVAVVALLNPSARALAPHFFRRFRRFRMLRFLAPVNVLNPSCRLG